MSNINKQNKLRGLKSVRAMVVATTLSFAAFGCTTNQFHTAGEPSTLGPAGGSRTPSMSTTPGSAGPSVPSTMISSAVDAGVDAQAVLEANRGYEGRVLGPAAPGNGTTEVSQQHATGQFISPSVLANPQTTVNRSLSSSGVPAVPAGDGAGVTGSDAGAIFSGATASGATIGNAATSGGVGAAAANAGNFGVTGLSNTTATGVAGGATAATAAAATANGATALSTVGNAGTTAGTNANFGATGVSNTTATGLTNVTTPGTNIGTGTNQVVSTGAAAAPSRLSSVLATPTLGTAGRLNVDNTAVARGARTRSGALTLDANGIARNTATVGSGNGVRVVTVNGRIVVTNDNP